MLYSYTKYNMRIRKVREIMRLAKTAVWALVAILITACGKVSNCTETGQPLQPTSATFAGVWKTSYGDVYFPKYTSNEVRGAFWSYPESNGQADNGRIIATVDGRKLVGYWVEDSGERPCATEKDGSLHWGPVNFEANDHFTEIGGAWGFCDQEPEGDDAGWVGTRD